MGGHRICGGGSAEVEAQLVLKASAIALCELPPSPTHTRMSEEVHKSDWKGMAESLALERGRLGWHNCLGGHVAGQRIRVVMGMGCYGNQRAGRYKGRCPQCVVSVMCSGPLSSFPVPGQHILGLPEVQLLLVNAWSVNNKALVQDLIEEQAVLACITETWLTLEDPLRYVPNQVLGLTAAETPGQGWGGVG